MRTLPVSSALAMVTVASYLAWIGQIGVQLVLPAHTRRPLSLCELRPAGVCRTLRVTPGYGLPSGAFSGLWYTVPVTCLPRPWSTSDGGMPCMLYS
ncbi:hypothetical protein D3C77_474970 [compost metagenome]